MQQRIAIIGLGLIGSSLARALAQNRPDLHIAGYDKTPTSLDYARDHAFLHSGHATPQEAAAQAGIVVLATPPAAFAELAERIRPALREGAILTDTGSVKRLAVSAIAPHVPAFCRYVPGHPIAGSAQSGVKAGRADLFTDRQVILTPEESALHDPAVATIKSLWESTGARVEFMPPDVHDRIYAYVSHLPQLLAFAARAPLKSLAAESDAPLRLTRLMASDGGLWADIFSSNADYVLEALQDYLIFASQMQGELSQAEAKPEDTAAAEAPLFAALIATCLIATASQLQETLGIHPARYAGAGFADMIAAAGTGPDAILAAISRNHAALAAPMEGFLGRLRGMQGILAKGDKEALLNGLSAL